jgi:hypothetical protein
MKYVGRFMRKVVPYGAALLATTLVVSANAQTQQGEARVYGLKGSADYSDGGGTWMPLRVGKVLRAGSLIRTAAESEVNLNLKQNGPTVRVTENTTMGLDKLLFEMTGADIVIETRLDLQKGRIQGRVNKTSDASKYEVKTPRLVAGIRGTEYDITADGMVVVKSGTVSVAFIKADGTQLNFTVNEKQTFDPAIPGVRGATDIEVRDITFITPPSDRFMIVYEPGREPYVSPISGKDVPSSTSSPN